MLNPFINSFFYPIPDKKYVCFCSDYKSNKRFPYWDFVLFLISKRLKENGFVMTQIMSEESSISPYCQPLILREEKHQFFLVENSSLVFGDNLPLSFLAHFKNKNFICVSGDLGSNFIYERISPNFLPSITSDKANENQIQKFIKPEFLANFILEKLGLEPLSTTTKWIGHSFPQTLCDIVPNGVTQLPQAAKNSSPNIRMDIVYNFENLKTLISSFENCSVTTNKPFEVLENFNLKSISHVNYSSNSFCEKFISNLTEKGIKVNLTCTDESTLKNERLKFFDLNIAYLDKEQECQKIKKILPENYGDLKLVSTKKIYDKDGSYFSYREILGDFSSEFLLDSKFYILYD